MKYFINKFIFISAAVSIVNSLPASQPHSLITSHLTGFESSPPQGLYFDQDIDHFGEKGGTFQQLYYESLSEEDVNNLKFLYIGGENALSTGSVALNFMSQLADQFLADKYALEHRFYGQSQPFQNLTVESLKYLTIDQTVEDIRNFIQVINQKSPNVKSKWILFGGSYAGNIAVWTRMLYPELVLGVVASSAPVQAQLNFKEYLESVSKVMQEKDQECNAIVKHAMNKMVQTFKTKTGKENIASLFKMCEQPKDQYDKYSLTSYIAALFTDAVEYNIKTANGQDRLTLLCQDLKSRKGDDLEKLASLVVQHYSINSDCFNYNYDSSKVLFENKINIYNNERQWLYQKCTELGYFQTTDSIHQPFAHSLPLIYYTKLCKDAFGNNFDVKTITEGIEKTNTKYKGKHLESMTNLIMVHGSSDPWIKLGVLSFNTDTSKGVIINDGWHCQDMMMASENDPDEMKKSREIIKNIIEHWASD